MMAKTQPNSFDSADYLNSVEDIAAYLDAYLEESSPEELRTALDTIARSRGASDLSKRSGVTTPGIHKALGQHGSPSFERVRDIVAALGFRLIVAPAQEREAAESL